MILLFNILQKNKQTNVQSTYICKVQLHLFVLGLNEPFMME